MKFPCHMLCLSLSRSLSFLAKVSERWCKEGEAETKVCSRCILCLGHLQYDPYVLTFSQS